MPDTPNKSIDNQPKGSARSPSETLDRDVGDSRRVTKPEEQDAALEAAGARELGQREENLAQDRREAEQGLKPGTG